MTESARVLHILDQPASPPKEEVRICGACPRELKGKQAQWCSKYCQGWALEHPGERQAEARPIREPSARSFVPEVSDHPCEAGCGRMTMTSEFRGPRKFCSVSCRKWASTHRGQRRDEAAKGRPTVEDLMGMFERLQDPMQVEVLYDPSSDPGLRERVGRVVRQTWVSWAMEQVNPKPSWLVGFDQLDSGQQEVDMRIGMTLYLMGQREMRSGDGQAQP